MYVYTDANARSLQFTCTCKFIAVAAILLIYIETNTSCFEITLTAMPVDKHVVFVNAGLLQLQLYLLINMDTSAS